MKKKSLSLLLIIIMIIGTMFGLTGCGENKDNKNTKNITENYNDGKLEYDFDEENKTAIVKGLKSSLKSKEKDEISEIIIPSTVVKDNTNYKVSSMKAGSYNSSIFSGLDNLKSIVIPTDFTLPQYAFSECYSVEEITIPSGITKIQKGTFYECNSLKNFPLPNTVTEVGDLAFAYCNNLETVSFPNSVSKIGGQIFIQCEKLKSVKLPDNLESLEGRSF